MNDEWYTPKYIIDALGPFDMDPCAPTRNFRTAPVCFTKKDDGLKQKWRGLVWCNPPFSEPLPWVIKMCLHDSGILLARASTDTKWMDWVFSHGGLALFTSGRLKFISKSGLSEKAANHGNVIVAFGELAEERLRAAHYRGQIDGRLFAQEYPSCEEDESMFSEFFEGLSPKERERWIVADAEEAMSRPPEETPPESFERVMRTRTKRLARAKAAARKEAKLKAAAKGTETPEAAKKPSAPSKTGSKPESVVRASNPTKAGKKVGTASKGRPKAPTTAQPAKRSQAAKKNAALKAPTKRTTSAPAGKPRESTKKVPVASKAQTKRLASAQGRKGREAVKTPRAALKVSPKRPAAAQRVDRRKPGKRSAAVSAALPKPTRGRHASKASPVVRSARQPRDARAKAKPTARSK